MTLLANFVYTPEQVRELDRIAIQELGIPGIELMRRASQFVFELALSRFPRARRWLILCGAGNNAGDGYMVAKLARAAGVAVEVAALCDPRRLSGDALRAWEDFQCAGGTVLPFSQHLCSSVDLVVDALLGTGLARRLEGDFLQAVESVNASGLPVIAVDIPSGLDGATGHVLGAAVRADLTATFIGRKQGLYLGAGPDHAGDILFADLRVPLDQATQGPPTLRVFDESDRARVLPRRSRSAHKGDFGHVLIIGGNYGMGGAARLAGDAALRAGAGLVSVATRPENVLAVTAQRPELMALGVTTAAEMEPLLSRATVIAIGPGLGQDTWAQNLFERVLAGSTPLVVDADALNLLAKREYRRDSWVLTPHPGEAGRLLGVPTAEVQANRLLATQRLCARFGGVALLKGRCTLIRHADEVPFVIDRGNPGMATPGMGDVLTGLIAGLLAQAKPGERLEATACAAYVHARAADDAARIGERGLIAGDLFPPLRAWLNPGR